MTDRVQKFSLSICCGPKQSLNTDNSSKYIYVIENVDALTDIWKLSRKEMHPFWLLK